MNPVLSSVVVEYKQSAMKLGIEKISFQPGMAIWMMKLGEGIYLLLDGQRRFIADRGIVIAKVVNPNTPPHLLKLALEDLNFKSSIAGEVIILFFIIIISTYFFLKKKSIQVTWVKQIRTLAEMKKNLKPGQNLMDLVKSNYITKSIGVLYFFFNNNNIPNQCC